MRPPKLSASPRSCGTTREMPPRYRYWSVAEMVSSPGAERKVFTPVVSARLKSHVRLSKLSEESAGLKVHFVAVSIDDAKDLPKIEPYLTKQNIHLDVWVGGNADMLGRFRLGNIVPCTLILDERGQVITRIMGEAKDDDVRSRLVWLLNGRPAPAPKQKLKRY